MKKIIVIFSILFTISGCKTSKISAGSPSEKFNQELGELKSLFHIPALSVIVKKGDEVVYEKYMGLSDVETNVVNDQSTEFPIASLTKVFAAVTIMKLAEEGKINLEEPVSKYIAHKSIADSIKIKHVLSHTSQGDVGQNFYYSSRFGWLTTIIEKASGNTFEKEINERIIIPLGLNQTYLLKDSTQLVNRKVAKPYIYEGEIKTGEIEYGYSAAAGINSTVSDLVKFDEALNKNTLISQNSKEKLFSSFKEHLPYGLGMFSQKFQNEDLIWAYGQYDCYSSLYIKVPGKNLTLLITANNNLMSDPARLIYGDVTYSLFALSFLKNYVFDMPQIPLLENSVSLSSVKDRINSSNSEIYRKTLSAQALAESFLSAYDEPKEKLSADLVETGFKIYPDYEKYADLPLLHNLSFLKTVAMHHREENFRKFDVEIEKIAVAILAKDRSNPYANYYLANHYSSLGLNELAHKYYAAILEAKNFTKGWYTVEAENWIKNHTKSKD